MFQDAQPATLDAETGADPWSPFRVCHPQECLTLLRQLRNGQHPVVLSGPDGSALSATLSSVDEPLRQLTFSVEPGLPALDRLVAKEKLTADAAAASNSKAAAPAPKEERKVVIRQAPAQFSIQIDYLTVVEDKPAVEGEPKK